MDISSWDGTLSSSDFCLAAHAFTEKWKRINPVLPPWSWVPQAKITMVEGYLSLENMCILRSCEVQSYSHDVRYFDFHIVYSASYRVPVLYFRTYSSDGQPLLLEDIEKELPGKSTNVLMESKWTFITQEEHPYLNRPWYKLHPCGTSEWMKLLFLTDPSLGVSQGVPVELYLSSWISMVGQAVGLKVPLEMFNKRKE
ncbi:hypothetical protein PVL29_009385 [Vitis rotundifolia]|uniref:Ubiquitin-like-conjugating enzyme ATG10 n=1 Tax=Vitis rotundifolia TaxID=103349 RepID=A0AA39DXG5_VITRO|nr:hypothetical protein PVL29_009385 [Vitis rotundifolia]